MVISVEKSLLNYCLDTVEKALPTRSTIPVIENIMLEITGERLCFTATNLELEVKVNLEHPGGEPGKILLPAKIVDIVRYLPAKEVQMSINFESHRIELASGQAKYNLYGSDPADYPLVQEAVPEGDVIQLEQDYLKQVLKKVVFAASTEETRPAFNGIYFQFQGNGVTLNASDTYRLVVKTISNQVWQFEEQRYLIPAKALRELLRITAEGGNVVSIFPHQKKVVFHLGKVYFATRVLEEKYPDVSGVIPAAYKTRVSLDSKMLEDTVSRASLLAEGINQAIQLSVRQNQLQIMVSSQVGRMEEVLAARQEGEDVEVFVNSRFIMDILKVTDSKEIMVDFHGHNGPIIFRLPFDDDYLYLVLPIKME